MKKISLIINRYICAVIAAICAITALTGCIEDGYVSGADAQPVFSVDELDMGTFFTEDVTPTSSFVVYNRHDKILSIGNIRLRSGEIFRINVDGMSGRDFNNVEIRPNDSIFVFVEAKIPLNGATAIADHSDFIDFTTAGVTRSIEVKAHGQDVIRMHGVVIESDTRWSADMPRRIFDSIVVAPGARLTLDPGVRLYFHDKAVMRVRGTLVSEGTPEAPVQLSGDRTDNVVGQIPFDLMAGQWGGVIFTSSSRDNRLAYTEVRNTVGGVVVDSIPDNGTPALSLYNCRLRNSQTDAIDIRHSRVDAVGCEFAEAAWSVARLTGGVATFNHCTFANYYLFSAIAEPTLVFAHYAADKADPAVSAPLMQADFSNCTVYGLGTDLSVGDFTGTNVFFRRCILKSAGSDDANFINCLWDTDPMYYTVREEYLFDYRVRPGSPAIGAADPSLTRPEASRSDFYGQPRAATPTIGAYSYVEM